MAAHADLVIPIGDSWWSPQSWAVLRSGGPLDLTDGWTVRAQAKTRRRDPTFFEWTVPNGRILLGTATISLGGGLSAVTSTIQLHHNGEDTDDWPEWDGVFDIEIRKELDVFTIVEGTVRANGDVTR